VPVKTALLAVNYESEVRCRGAGDDRPYETLSAPQWFLTLKY